MKKQYMQPAMQVVAVQHPQMLCSSPDNLNGQSVGSYSGSEEQISDKEEIW